MACREYSNHANALKNEFYNIFSSHDCNVRVLFNLICFTNAHLSR